MKILCRSLENNSCCWQLPAKTLFMLLPNVMLCCTVHVWTGIKKNGFVIKTGRIVGAFCDKWKGWFSEQCFRTCFLKKLSRRNNEIKNWDSFLPFVRSLLTGWRLWLLENIGCEMFTPQRTFNIICRLMKVGIDTDSCCCFLVQKRVLFLFQFTQPLSHGGCSTCSIQEASKTFSGLLRIPVKNSASV